MYLYNNAFELYLGYGEKCLHMELREKRNKITGYITECKAPYSPFKLFGSLYTYATTASQPTPEPYMWYQKDI